MSGADFDLLKTHRLMPLAPTVAEQAWMLNRQGKVLFVVSCQEQRRGPARHWRPNPWLIHRNLLALALRARRLTIVENYARIL
jgi:hypothetical protein